MIAFSANNFWWHAMDWVTFASKALDAVVWPITVLVLVFKFSDRFRELLGKLTEVSLPGGISGKFEQPLKEVEQLAKELPKAFDGGLQLAEGDPIALLANPTGVIMEAWKGLEAIASDLYQASDAPRRDKMLNYSSKHPQGIAALEYEKLIPNEEISLLRELRSIRNRVAHSTVDRPTPEDAERFTSVVRTLELVWLARLEAGKPK